MNNRELECRLNLLFEKNRLHIAARGAALGAADADH